MSQEITLKKCGVRFNPPAVVITYLINAGKLHRRTMPLRHFNKHSGVSRVAEELRSNARHKQYLDQLPLHQLEKMITMIKDRMNGLSVDDVLKKNKDLDKIDPNEDLNKVDEETLKHKKAIMADTFEKNCKKRGDPGFEYDVEVDFDAIESCDWDSDSDGGF